MHETAARRFFQELETSLFTDGRDPHETWNGLALFESHDFVRSWYGKQHGVEINTTWTQEINASFRQGREYFDSARAAGPAVKALLIYYGCSALARGATLVLTAKLIPGAIPSSHGLRAVKWAGHLQQFDIAGVLDLAVRCQPGLFPAFLDAVGNSSVSVLRSNDDDLLVPCEAEHGTPSLVSKAGQQITLMQLLERDHRVASTFQRVTGTFPRVHHPRIMLEGRYFRERAGNTFSEEDVWKPQRLNFGLVGSSERLNVQLVEKAFGQTTIISTIGGPGYKYVPERQLHWQSPVEASEVPMIVGDNYQTFLAEDFENGDRLTLLHRTYLVAFILGTLSRYHPSTWMALLQNVKGAGAQPLIRAALNVVEQDFPALLWQRLN